MPVFLAMYITRTKLNVIYFLKSIAVSASADLLYRNCIVFLVVMAPLQQCIFFGTLENNAGGRGGAAKWMNADTESS
jgi:hypothetical protein